MPGQVNLEKKTRRRFQAVRAHERFGSPLLLLRCRGSHTVASPVLVWPVLARLFLSQKVGRVMFTSAHVLVSSTHSWAKQYIYHSKDHTPLGPCSDVVLSCYHRRSVNWESPSAHMQQNKFSFFTTTSKRKLSNVEQEYLRRFPLEHRWPCCVLNACLTLRWTTSCVLSFVFKTETSSPHRVSFMVNGSHRFWVASGGNSSRCCVGTHCSEDRFGESSFLCIRLRVKGRRLPKTRLPAGTFTSNT